MEIPRRPHRAEGAEGPLNRMLAGMQIFVTETSWAGVIASAATGPAISGRST
jgi:hypothetical protein